MIERDRRGERGWIPLALVAHVVWLNLHGGFVVGMAFWLLHALAHAVFRRPFAHVIGVLAVMAALVALNPYGLAYYPYLASALTMSRPRIGEWHPIRPANPFGLGVYLASVAIAAAPCGQRLARSPMAHPAAAAIQRATSDTCRSALWVAYVPGWCGDRCGAITGRYGRPLGPVASALGRCRSRFLSQRPWRLTCPAPPRALPPYPVGRPYLAGHVRANALPFGVGRSCRKLHPRQGQPEPVTRRLWSSSLWSTSLFDARRLATPERIRLTSSSRERRSDQRRARDTNRWTITIGMMLMPSPPAASPCLSTIAPAGL
jgi:hypothetical protein